MYSSILILFTVAFSAGLFALYLPKTSTGLYKLALVFAGSYLFSITIVHILPELFFQDINPGVLGVFTLGGFFLQQGLDFLSKGVEHGHIHVHNTSHHHESNSALWVVIALSVHSLLEGGMLARSTAVVHQHNSNTLLWGIIIHKAPEAFALMSVLVCFLARKSVAVLYLIIFALASPVGLLLSDYLLSTELMSPRSFTYLLAVVSGNFLHISTTIVFESSADHSFNSRKMGIAVLAAVMAVMAELFL
ncbi:MAG: ZIP family metal transporter [Flammeovirgaceae bacterium]|nr:ZIP family metal transporter [Flammeovirgaceae bacterium]